MKTIIAGSRTVTGYMTPDDDIHLPFCRLNAVLLATDYIEKMGEQKWKRPLKKPKRQTVTKRR